MSLVKNNKYLLIKKSKRKNYSNFNSSKLIDLQINEFFFENIINRYITF